MGHKMDPPTLLYYKCLKYQPENLELINDAFNFLELPTPDSDTSELLAQVEILCAPLGYRVSREKIEQANKLKFVLSNTTGVAHIDVKAAEERGIEVCALHDEPEFLDQITPTAEHTIGLMLSAWRRIPSSNNFVLSGHWDRRPYGAPRMFSRMRLGIVGYGRLGRKVRTIAEAMGMSVDFFDPLVSGGQDSLLDLARKSDILSIHAVANKATKGLVSREVLSQLPPKSMVINTARGEILDLDALLDLMEIGHIYAAGLDVLDGEFNPGFEGELQNSRVINYAKKNDRLILTPHIGGSTYDAWFETERFVIEKVLAKIRRGNEKRSG